MEIQVCVYKKMTLVLIAWSPVKIDRNKHFLLRTISLFSSQDV